jgi:hypothetical protein
MAQITEADKQSCPFASDVNTEVPTPFAISELAAHPEDFAFPADGLALRRNLDATIIEDGIVHLGPPLPPIDCVGDGPFLTACSNAGSHVHVVVTIKPLDSD